MLSVVEYAVLVYGGDEKSRWLTSFTQGTNHTQYVELSSTNPFTDIIQAIRLLSLLPHLPHTPNRPLPTTTPLRG